MKRRLAMWLVALASFGFLFQTGHDRGVETRRLTLENQQTVHDLCAVVQRVNDYGDAQVSITSRRLQSAEDFLNNVQPGESPNLVARVKDVLPDYRQQRDQAIRLASATERPESCPQPKETHG